MSNKINIQVVEQNRPSLASFGNIYGRRIFKATRIPVITDFATRSEHAIQAKELFITRNINRYKVLSIDITAIELAKSLSDDYEIVINKGQVDENGTDIEVHCPITGSNFTKEVTTDTLIEALSKDGNNHNIFFSNAKKLAKFLNDENAKEQSKVAALRKELEQIEGMLEATSEKNTAYTEAYYRQLDDKKTSSVNVHVNIDLFRVCST